MFSTALFCPHLLERFRTQEAQVHLARLRNPVNFPATYGRLRYAANPGDGHRPAERVNDLSRYLCLIHAR